MKKNVATLIIIVVVVVLGLLFYFGNSIAPKPSSTATSTSPSTETDTLGHSQMVNGVTLTPLEVLEDSRCATDVQCVWAGRFTVRTNISKPSDNSTDVLELGKAYDNGSEIITLVNVSPANVSGKKLMPEDYHFTFLVTTKVGNGTSSSGGCYVGGCSGQICSDEAGAVSTCEYTASYACYQSAKCERQATGKCGWTETAELKMCLMNSSSH